MRPLTQADRTRLLSVDHDRYRCDQCGSIIWHTKTGVERVKIPCPEPCRGVMRKVNDEKTH